MIEAVTFDAPKFARHLTGAGMPAEQAEALAAELVTELVNQINSNVVTKDAQSDFATKADLEVLQAKIVAAIADARADAAEREKRVTKEVADARADAAEREKRVIEKIADEGKESARRETRNTWLLVGTIIAATGAIIAAMQLPSAA